MKTSMGEKRDNKLFVTFLIMVTAFIFFVWIMSSCKKDDCATCLKESWETKNGNTIYNQESFEACGSEVDYWDGRKTDESFIFNNQWVNYKTETKSK